MTEPLWMLVGLVAGGAVVLLVLTLRRRQEDTAAARIIRQLQEEKAAEVNALSDKLKTAFDALSKEALSANADDFLKLAKTRFDQQSSQAEEVLEGKKKLIDARLEEMGNKLATLNQFIQSVEKQRAESHGTLASQLKKATDATNRLQDTTGQLREALASPQRRGQWGERMAEDVLRLAGFLEGVNYAKQVTLGEGGRPDFTFLLPGGQKVHMDVKFPLDNYLRMLDATDDHGRVTATGQFLKDVRARIKEVTTRAYIDPSDGTVDYVLVFIPNEQVYGFIHEQDPRLLDDAMRSKVVLCSPLTLYAILAVIRQSVDNFRLEQASTQILALLAEFKKQWTKYAESMDKMGARLDAATKEYQHLVGVRTRQLVRQLDKIEDLRAMREDQATRSLPAVVAPDQQDEGAMPSADAPEDDDA